MAVAALVAGDGGDLAACGGEPTVTRDWEGSGETREVPLADDFREPPRNAVAEGLQALLDGSPGRPRPRPPEVSADF